ncbi:hypothetical protein B0H13DRAFT_2280071 [Mycena leptocephala]|nr:hypothetical protein B0H13DRAFT_2280071 [Mycena leptocephala]
MIAGSRPKVVNSPSSHTALTMFKIWSRVVLSEEATEQQPLMPKSLKNRCTVTTKSAGQVDVFREKEVHGDPAGDSGKAKTMPVQDVMRSRVIILACCEDWSEHCAQQAVRTFEFFSSHFEGETLNFLSMEKMQKQCGLRERKYGSTGKKSVIVLCTKQEQHISVKGSLRSFRKLYTLRTWIYSGSFIEFVAEVIVLRNAIAVASTVRKQSLNCHLKWSRSGWLVAGSALYGLVADRLTAELSGTGTVYGDAIEADQISAESGCEVDAGVRESIEGRVYSPRELLDPVGDGKGGHRHLWAAACIEDIAGTVGNTTDAIEVATFEDGVEVEEAKGESGLSTEGGRNGGSNFLRLDGVTGAEAVESGDLEVSSEGAEPLVEILSAVESTLRQRVPVGPSS